VTSPHRRRRDRRAWRRTRRPRDCRPDRLVPAAAVLRGADAAGPTRVSKAPHAGDV